MKPIKVFIGSGESSLLERKVLIYSLRKHSDRALDIYVMNGTHNAIELNDQPPVLAPMSLKVKYQNVTEFSLYRYLIPQICEYRGKAIYLDSDMLCLADIGNLFDGDLNDRAFSAKREAYTQAGDKWGLSVMVIDCEKSRFDLETYCDEIAKGQYSYQDFSCMSSAFLQHHFFSIAELDPNWNVFDFCDCETKLIHYTNLYTQPWKTENHPFGERWFQYFNEALHQGYVTERDIELSLLRYSVRQNIREGNSPSKSNRSLIFQSLKHTLKSLLKR